MLVYVWKAEIKTVFPNEVKPGRDTELLDWLQESCKRDPRKLSKLYYFFKHDPVDPVYLRRRVGGLNKTWQVHPGMARMVGVMLRPQDRRPQWLDARIYCTTKTPEYNAGVRWLSIERKIKTKLSPSELISDIAYQAKGWNSAQHMLSLIRFELDTGDSVLISNEDSPVTIKTHVKDHGGIFPALQWLFHQAQVYEQPNQELKKYLKSRIKKMS